MSGTQLREEKQKHTFASESIQRPNFLAEELPLYLPILTRCRSFDPKFRAVHARLLDANALRTFVQQFDDCTDTPERFVSRARLFCWSAGKTAHS